MPVHIKHITDAIDRFMNAYISNKSIQHNLQDRNQLKIYVQKFQ